VARRDWWVPIRVDRLCAPQDLKRIGQLRSAHTGSFKWSNPTRLNKIRWIKGAGGEKLTVARVPTSRQRGCGSGGWRQRVPVIPWGDGGVDEGQHGEVGLGAWSRDSCASWNSMEMWLERLWRLWVLVDDDVLDSLWDRTNRGHQKVHQDKRRIKRPERGHEVPGLRQNQQKGAVVVAVSGEKNSRSLAA
jgi:hypothetical protein